jgi:AP2-like factor (euAP2 lineage)
MKQIPLTQGKFAIVDDEDFHYLSRFNWNVASDGSGHFHARRSIRSIDQKGEAKGDVYLGMEAMIIPPKLYSNIQHLNKDTLDYRKENLFYESYSVKRHRADKQAGRCSSKYKGVCFYKKNHAKGKPWSAYVYRKSKDGGKEKRLHGGYFATQEEAARKYNQMAIELYGDMAYQNKIKE